MATIEDVEIYYILQPGAEKERGPYSLNELRTMWENGTIDENTMWAVQGMEGWDGLATLKKQIFPEQFIEPPIFVEPPKITARSLDDVYRRNDEQQVERARGQMGVFATTFVIGLVLISLLVVFGVIASSTDTPEDKAERRRSGAYDYTRAVIRDRYPGAKEFLRYGVTREGNKYHVVTVVDGLNAFGGPVRTEFDAKLEWSDGGGWTLVELKQN